MWEGSVSRPYLGTVLEWWGRPLAATFPLSLGISGDKLSYGWCVLALIEESQNHRLRGLPR